MKSSVFVLLSLLLHYSNGARILAVLPLAAFSHQVMFKPILRELANRKHDVTVITSSPDDNANYKQIIVDNSYATSNINFFKLQNSHRFNTFISISRIGETTVHTALKNPEVQRIIHSPDLHFDLILVEATFAQEALVVFGHKFRAPIVELVSTSSSFWLNELISNPNTFSYIVDCRTSSSDKMDFSERLSNTIGGIGALVLHRLSLLPRQEAIAKQYFNYSGWESRPPLIELLSNISLAIINTHVALHYPHPNNPNVIEVAGIHLKQPKKLPDELQIYLDNATEGVIYFSLGSNVKGSMMPEHVRRAFIQAFGKLPYKVLWKWDEKSLTGQTDNVKISKWLPQTDVLAHSNVKVFISHGGLLSITESVNHEVPMIIIPLFSDQWKNSIQAETAGFGITLKLDNITEDSVVWAVKEILTKSKYKEAARKHSSLLQDNPLKPLDTAIFWIEYVIRHQGAPHLQTAASRLYWYQYFLIDVVAVLVLGILTVLFLVYKVLKVIFFILLKITVSRKHVNTIKKNK